MQSENFATNIHAHYRQSETAPHIRALYVRKISPRYMKNRGVAGMMCARLIGVGILAFVYIMFCICGNRLKKGVFLLIG